MLNFAQEIGLCAKGTTESVIFNKLNAKYKSYITLP